MTSAELLRASELTKSYGSTAALRGLSVTISTGEIVAVTGPSGCGKSTLLHCLAGILLPDTGEVQFRGKSLRAMGDRERSRLRRTEIGVLFQFGQLVAELSAVENAALPLLLDGARRDVAEAQARRWLERFGVLDVAGELPGEMSGGQAQRVALARALVTSPAVLFADEPTGALDSLSGEKVLEAIVTHARREGVAVVLVTHDAKVAAYADREILLRDGALQPVGVS